MEENGHDDRDISNLIIFRPPQTIRIPTRGSRSLIFLLNSALQNEQSLELLMEHFKQSVAKYEIENQDFNYSKQFWHSRPVTIRTQRKKIIFFKIVR